MSRLFADEVADGLVRVYKFNVRPRVLFVQFCDAFENCSVLTKKQELRKKTGLCVALGMEWNYGENGVLVVDILYSLMIHY